MRTERETHFISVAALCIVALMCAPESRAAPLMFFNPAPGEAGHADWESLELLDITMPASQQTGELNGFEIFGTFRYTVSTGFDEFTGEFFRDGVIETGFGGRVMEGEQNTLLFSPLGELVGPSGIVPDNSGGGRLW